MIDCLLEVTVLNGEYQRFVTFMNQHPRAFFAYRVAGQSCFFIKLSVSSLEEIEAFIQDVSGFTKTVSHIVLSEHSFTHPIHERVKQIEEPEMTVVK